MVIPRGSGSGLASAWSSGYKKDIVADPETEICVAVGGMEALFCTVLTLMDEGDEVILPSPPTPPVSNRSCWLAGGLGLRPAIR